MRHQPFLAGAAVLALQVTVLGAPARAEGLYHVPAGAVGGMASALSSSQRDRAIERAFREVLDRKPSDRELRRYRELMDNEDWTEDDVRDDLRDRSGERRRSEDPDRIVRRAYDDILRREPDTDGLRLYRSRIIDDDWTEEEVRSALRESPEYEKRRLELAEQVVRRAYDDILRREPDTEGLRLYRRRIVDDDWSEKDVREALRKSPEYQKRRSELADEVVRRAYEDVLGRQPDAAGLTLYRNRILRDEWDERRVREALKKSPEYRGKHP